MKTMSQSEVSQSIARSKYAGLLDDSGKKVMRQALYDEQLHVLLALVDALRVGKAREKIMAVRELKNRIW